MEGQRDCVKRDLCGLGFFFRNKRSTQGRQRPLRTAPVEAHKNTRFTKSLFTALLSHCGRSVSDSVQAGTPTRWVVLDLYRDPPQVGQVPKLPS